MPNRPGVPWLLAAAVTALAVAVAVMPSGAVATPGHGHTTHHVSHRAAEQALQHARDLLSTSGKAHARRSQGPGDLTLALRRVWLARTSLTGADRRAASGLLARPTDTGGDNLCYVDDPCPVRLTQTADRITTHFVIHYTTATGRNRATRTFVDAVAHTLEHVYATETGMGFRTPVSDGATAHPGDIGNPNGKFDVFLADTGRYGVYGYTNIDATTSTAPQQPAYLVLDNNFSTSKFCFSRPCTPPLDSMRVTVAHEFFHAIQFAYDVLEDTWLMEGSAVWMEDRVYDGINDYRQYVADSPIRYPRTPVDHDGFTDVYGAFTVFKFLTGWMHDPAAVRQVWERTAAPDVYSLQAVDDVILRHHHSLRAAYAHFGVWNTLPPGSYPGERAGYGAAGYWKSQRLSRSHRSTGTLTTGLRHLANAPLRLLPARGLSRHQRLRVTVNLPAASRGAVATVQVRGRHGSLSLMMVPLDRYGNGHRVVAFAPRRISSVVVVLTNGSTRMRACPDNPDPYTCGGHGTYDGDTYRVRANLT